MKLVALEALCKKGLPKQLSAYKRMIEVVNSPEATNCIRLDNNRSNKKLGL